MKFPGKRLIVEYKNRRARKNVKSLWGDIDIKEIARAVEDDTAAPSDTKTGLPEGHAPEKPAAKATEPVAASATAGGRILAALPPATIIDDASQQNRANRAEAKFAARSKHDRAKSGQKQTIESPSQGVETNNERMDPVFDTALSARADAALDAGSEQSAPSERTPIELPVAAASSAIVEPLPVKQQAATAGASTAKRNPIRPRRQAVVRNDRTAARISGKEPRPPVAGFYQFPDEFNDELSELDQENNALKQSLIKQLQAENRQLEKMILRACSPIETEWRGKR